MERIMQIVRKVLKPRIIVFFIVDIIMIILIVSSIIGFSVFIRSIRDKKSIKQERESAEAYEVVDMILDNMLLSTSEQWEEKMSKDHDIIMIF